jgi:hypothetical protein
LEIAVSEVSAGVYEVVTADVTGPLFRTIGPDPSTLVETANAWVRELFAI